MERHVFRYRSSVALMASSLVLWGAGWLIGTLGARNQVHDGPLPWFSVTVGIAALLAAVMVVVGARNWRIETEGDEVLWFNSLGRLKVKGSLRDAKAVRDSNLRASIDTDDGTISFHTSIDQFGLLWSLVEGKGTLLKHCVRFVPPTRVYSYRWGVLHLVSLVCIGVFGTAGAVLLIGGSPFGAVAPFLIPTLFLGLLMQIRCWQERIEIGKSGILWVDGLGRTRVRAQLDQIVAITEDFGEEPTGFNIYTTEGTIRTSKELRGHKLLLEDLRQVLATREIVG